MSREGHKNTDLRQERTAGPCFIWLLIGLDGTCKSSSARWPEENACLLLGEGAVIILQELRQLFHIENFLSVEEDGFEGSGFFILRKYSLQGTTQGRYLTGGVPPVRFSM